MCYASGISFGGTGTWRHRKINGMEFKYLLSDNLDQYLHVITSVHFLKISLVHPKYKGNKLNTKKS
jgi:hypothetical protein